MDVSIIIVNYNTCNLLKNCIKSIYENTNSISFEIIVSDNGSTDGSIEMLKENFPDVILIENNSNLGFGTANNKGLEKANGKYIFYLNSDTLLLNNAVKIFYDYFEENNHNSIGVLGCNLMNSKMETNFSCGTFGSSYGLFKELVKLNIDVLKKTIKKTILKEEFADYYYINKKHERKLGNVDYICGADLFLLNNSLAKFDEQYFLYYEEIDLQYQFYKNNLQRILIEGPEIIHLSGQSSKKTTKEVLRYKDFSELNKVISKFKYYKKNISSNFMIFILKCLQLILWNNSYLINETKKYIPILKKV